MPNAMTITFLKPHAGVMAATHHRVRGMVEVMDPPAHLCWDKTRRAPVSPLDQRLVFPHHDEHPKR